MPYGMIFSTDIEIQFRLDIRELKMNRQNISDKRIISCCSNL